MTPILDLEGCRAAVLDVHGECIGEVVEAKPANGLWFGRKISSPAVINSVPQSGLSLMVPLTRPIHTGAFSVVTAMPMKE